MARLKRTPEQKKAVAQIRSLRDDVDRTMNKRNGTEIGYVLVVCEPSLDTYRVLPDGEIVSHPHNRHSIEEIDR